jgi:hypothetical protein
MDFEKVLDNYNEYCDVRILNELFPLLSGLGSITVSLKPPSVTWVLSRSMLYGKLWAKIGSTIQNIVASMTLSYQIIEGQTSYSQPYDSTRLFQRYRWVPFQ